MIIRPSIASLFLLSFATVQVFGQNEEDALRFSSILPGGTARSWALGGAMGAVGADPGSATTNPAGFGLYNTSEFSLTPQFEVNNSKSDYYGTTATDSDNRFSFGNLSLILSSPNDHGSDWRSGVFGISFDRQASFHWEEHAVGNEVPSTILQKFVNEANGTAPGYLAVDFPFTSDLAYETYGIDPLDTTANTYISTIPFGSAVAQDHRISTAGRMNTTSFFYAANYLDKLYVGATIGLTGVRYERQTSHQETSLDTALDLKDLNYTEKLLTTGSGVDLKLGVIGRMGDHVRLGLAFHSPKWLQLSDAYTYSMSTHFRTPDANGNTRYIKDSPDGSFNYRVRTPWNVLVSAAYIAGQHGLVSIDYGYTDFRQAKLNKSLDRIDDYDFSTENDAIRSDFRATHSVRVGTEWRAGAWYFRGGWGIWPDAHANSDARQGTSYMRYTAGAGFRSKHLSIDLTGVYGTRDINYFPYDPALVAPVHERLTDSRGMLTLAFRP
ncbi:MAG: hypothetical protein K8H89_11165 [Flavobacteriales bacterium]|jgi:hypothetical protein|nr:hypothetical protein [Flavobacteriales bacterium]